MSTKHQTGLVGVFRCPDPRNALALAIGTTSPLEWGIVEFPSMAGSIPPGAVEEVERLGVQRIMVIVHGEFEQFAGCGARQALALLKEGKQLSVVAARKLPSWLEANIRSSEPYEQAVRVSCDAGMAFEDAEILTVLFDQVTQTMYPLAVKPVIGGDWLYVEREAWELYRVNHLDSAVPSLDARTLQPWMQRILMMNHSLAGEAAEIAEQAGYGSFDVKCVVANTTPYAPDAFNEVRKLLGINKEDPQTFAAPYYSVYCHPDHPDWWMPQLLYAYDHLKTHGVKIIFLGHDEETVNLIARVHNEDPYYRKVLRAYGGVEYALVLDPPRK
jgi:hypothetical protein